MPASIKLQEEYGDDLAVIFVESQGTSPEDTARFAMSHKWLGNRAMWTNERPFDSGSRGLPNFTLLSAAGKVLAKGSSVSSKHIDLIDEEIKRGNGAPAGTHKSFQKAWKQYGKGNYAKAIAEAQKLGAKKADLADEAGEVVAQIEQKIQAKLKRATWLLENGYPERSKSAIDSLAKGLKGTDDLLASALEVRTRFESDESQLEFEAAAKINRLLAKVYEDGRDEKMFVKLGKLVGQYEGTQVAKRAQAIVAMGS